MKRNENIIPISRDHHLGLLCCWKIKEGVKKHVNYDRIRDYINYSWENDLKDHFAEEERLLFVHSNDQYTRQALKEHQEITNLVCAINHADDVDLLSYFADSLQKHMKFEEQTVFPFLEEILTEQTLKNLGKILWESHEPKEDDYADEFWK